MSLVRESQSPSVGELQDERLGSQLLRFQLQLDRADPRVDGAASSYLAELAIEMTTSTVRQGVTELIDIPSDRVVPIPHLPPAVIGVYNWRGEILWVVDLAILLGANTRRYHPERRFYPTIAVSSGDNTIGLVVAEIADIEWCELVPSIAHPDPQLSPWIKGAAIATTGERLMILDELALVDRADLHAQI